MDPEWASAFPIPVSVAYVSIVFGPGFEADGFADAEKQVSIMSVEDESESGEDTDEDDEDSFAIIPRDDFHGAQAITDFAFRSQTVFLCSVLRRSSRLDAWESC